jgi:hypothetical protein
LPEWAADTGGWLWVIRFTLSKWGWVKPAEGRRLQSYSERPFGQKGAARGKL